MCIAIVQTKGTYLTRDEISRGWKTNPDGGGFCYVRDGKTVIEKGFMKEDDFVRAYNNAMDKHSDESPFLVHFRITTSGGTSPNNCHPFPVKGGALIHNGIMFTPPASRAGPAHDPRSDTRVFAEDLYNILNNEHVKTARDGILKAIGHGNKIAFLYDNREVVIVGEERGYWEKGIWYSNLSCAVSRTYTK